MLLCLRCERFDQALDVLTKLEKDQNNIVGVPNIEALQLFTDMCISRNKITEALVSFNIISLKYCSLYMPTKVKYYCAILAFSFFSICHDIIFRTKFV